MATAAKAGQSLQSHAVKSKGMPGVTSDKSGTNGMKQTTSDLHQKFKAVRHHA